MSTKTSFKRIALVAVAALGMGVLTSVSPASAAAALPVTTTTLACEYADGGAQTADATTCNGVAGVANRITLGSQADATKAVLITVSGAGSTITGIANGTLGGTIASTNASILVAAATVANTEFYVSTPSAGTIVANSYVETSAGSGIFSATADKTVTITVNPSALTNVYNAAKSTFYANTGGTAGDAAADATYAGGVSVAATLDAATEVANITVTQKDSAGNNLTSGFKTVTATITGAGLLSTGATATGASVSTSAAAVTTVAAYANGTAGKGVISVSVDGVVVKTLTVTFFGTVASLTATVKKSYLQASTNTIADVIFVDAKDSNGNLVANTPTITSATAGVVVSGTCAASNPTTTPATPAKCTITTGATTGSSLLTITASTVTTVTTTATVNVSKSVAKTIVLGTNKTSFTPGEKATLSLTLTDSEGKPVASGTYTTALVAALTSSAALTSTLEFDVADPATATTITVIDGKATVDFYVPITSGPVTISGTYGTGPVVGLLASTALTTTFTVSDSASVAALTTLINSLIKKINALATLVAKIQKKLGVK